jgi:hypothetical protein
VRWELMKPAGLAQVTNGATMGSGMNSWYDTPLCTGSIEAILLATAIACT